jgi:hypothetical protein
MRLSGFTNFQQGEFKQFISFLQTVLRNFGSCLISDPCKDGISQLVVIQASNCADKAFGASEGGRTRQGLTGRRDEVSEQGGTEHRRLCAHKPAVTARGYSRSRFRRRIVLALRPGKCLCLGRCWLFMEQAANPRSSCFAKATPRRAARGYSWSIDQRLERPIFISKGEICFLTFFERASPRHVPK